MLSGPRVCGDCDVCVCVATVTPLNTSICCYSLVSVITSISPKADVSQVFLGYMPAHLCSTLSQFLDVYQCVFCYTDWKSNLEVYVDFSVGL